MDNVVTVTNTKENILEFELTVQGLSAKKVEAKFIIKAKGMEFAFPCESGEGNKWSVTIPPMPQLERTAYNCCISVVADGYYFEPMTGTVNVVGTHEVYSSTPKNKTVEPDTEEKKEKKKAPPKKKAKKEEVKETAKSREKGIDQIARELMEKKVGPDIEKTKEADDKVHEVLESVGINVTKKPSGKRPRLGLVPESKLPEKDEPVVKEAKEEPKTEPEKVIEKPTEPDIQKIVEDAKKAVEEKKLIPEDLKPKKVEPKKPEPKKEEPKVVKEEKKPEPAKVIPLEPPVPATKEKDEQVVAMLEEFGIRPKKKVRTKFSLRD